MSVDEPSELESVVAETRAVEGPAFFVDEPSELSKSVADARAVEGPALSVDEPSEQSKSVADARALEGLCFFRLAFFRFAADKAASPMVHDVKQSKSIAYARVVEGPALFVDEPSELSKSVADARAVEACVFSALPFSASQRTRRPAPWCMM